MDLDPKYDDYDFPYTAAEKQDGHPGFLTELQIAQVHQLRMMLEAEGYTERLDTLTMVMEIPAPRPPSLDDTMLTEAAPVPAGAQV